MSPLTWHVVVNDDGTILAVYGSALLAEAQEMARSISAKIGFPCTRLVQLTSGADPARPRVGQRISDLLRLGLMHQRSV